MAREDMVGAIRRQGKHVVAAGIRGGFLTMRNG
jgi:hypothetical protein